MAAWKSYPSRSRGSDRGTATVRAGMSDSTPASLRASPRHPPGILVRLSEQVHRHGGGQAVLDFHARAEPTPASTWLHGRGDPARIPELGPRRQEEHLDPSLARSHLRERAIGGGTAERYPARQVLHLESIAPSARVRRQLAAHRLEGAHRLRARPAHHAQATTPFRMRKRYLNPRR